MKKKFVLSLIVFGLSAFLTQTLSAAQALAVANNGKWDMEYDNDPYGNVNAVAAKALAACKAKGGTDPKIVWSQAINIKWNHPAIINGAIAVSDNGTGTIVGWSFNQNSHANGRAAGADCRRKGGKNPKVVARF